MTQSPTMHMFAQFQQSTLCSWFLGINPLIGFELSIFELSIFYSWEGKKVSKNPYEIKVQGLVSNREGVKHPKRLRYSKGASCLNYLVLINCLFICKILP